MKRNAFVGLSLLAAVTALTVGCSSDKEEKTGSPLSPALGAARGATPDPYVNLKVTKPVPVSPINDFRVEDTPTLVATASTGLYVNKAVQYDFEVYDKDNNKIDTDVVATPSYKVRGTLAFDSRYTWRVRGCIPAQNAYGPWSEDLPITTASFKSPEGGYSRGAELFDPLTNGKTIGRAFDTTFVPQGIKLNGQHSFVEYTLGATLNEGEISAMITNLGNGSEEWKTKVLSMLAGDGVNVTDNEYRLTLDKRTGWVGQGSPARYTFCIRPNCFEVNAGPRSWDRTHNYFWQFTWKGGVNRLVVLDNGAPFVDIKTGHTGTYKPTPHLVRLGSVGGRGGDDTNPGTIIWNLWVSGNARPNFPTDKR